MESRLKLNFPSFSSQSILSPNESYRRFHQFLLLFLSHLDWDPSSVGRLTAQQGMHQVLP